jgi:hypothetical protein
MMMNEFSVRTTFTRDINENRASFWFSKRVGNEIKAAQRDGEKIYIESGAVN